MVDAAHEGPSRWQQLFGKPREGGSRDGTAQSLPHRHGNQDDDDSRPTWVDDWERQKMLVQATLDPEDADNVFSAPVITKQWEAGRCFAEHNNHDEDLDTVQDVRQRVRAAVHVEATAQAIKAGIKTQAGIGRNTFLPHEPANPAPLADPTRTMAVRQELVHAKRAARAAGLSAARPMPPHAVFRIQNPFTRKPKPAQPPAIDTLQHINARHAAVDKKRSERMLKTAAVPPPAPMARRSADALRKQTLAVEVQLQHEMKKLAALETARQNRHAARAVLEEAFATWWSVVSLHQTMMAQAARAHAWHIQRSFFVAWRICVRHNAHAREVATAEAAAARQHRADLRASLHFRKCVLLKVFAQWTTYMTRTKATKRAAAGFEARQSRAAFLLTQVMQTTAAIDIATTAMYRTSCTSPSLPTSAATTAVAVAPTRRWTSTKRPPPPQRDTHKDVATSPRKARPRAPRIPIVQNELPPRILDMRAREAERKKRWEALQVKYKEAQAAREEAARVAAAAALAEMDKQKAAAAASKLEKKREHARAEAEKEHRRQLAVEQWALAKQHYLRSIVLFQGWRPWRHLVATRRTMAIKAMHWHHDMLLQHRFVEWVAFRDTCRAQARAILATRLRAAATWHHRRLLAHITSQWKGHRATMIQREESLRSIVHRHLVRRVWDVVKSLRQRRESQARQAQAKHERGVKRRALHAWVRRVNIWTKEAATKREKDALWQKVHVWLAED
ncbi:hypothetical protein H310_11086 [Aphanomyces invadans]|uniref:Sfi1 spindle body domain-containing protein n=1 Tax=Aphanomyces invadans TaxID=157072 RepID=A0A024TQM5_9STRA|nr:hypothetical protein H310_11086 [Aphanomyces invadans]ETV95667.1 hypothetical protein H310_11086 [Aphanomyces invadans]|eukprot:XP_008875860.1 hypothetical protein H310_11086 [Aphanomyces invadans]